MKAHVAELQAEVAAGKGDEPVPSAPKEAAVEAEDGTDARVEGAADSEKTYAQELEDVEAQLARLTTELDDKHKYARGGAPRRSRFE